MATSDTDSTGDIMGVVLAGGRARRMGGGDKTLTSFAGRSILAHVVERMLPQVGTLALNTNSDHAAFAKWQLTILRDATLPGVELFAGPLAGIHAALVWANAEGAAALLTVPGDAPFPPTDLARRLAAAGGPAYAIAGGQAVPVMALWPAGEAALVARLLASGVRRVRDALDAFGAVPVDVAAEAALNINTPEDLAAAERLYGSMTAAHPSVGAAAT